MASAVANLANRNSNNTRFNAEAAAWDARPFVHEASEAAAKAILAQLDKHSIDKTQLKILEIGCGTGILSFLLAPHVQSICAVDAASGMIDVLKQKLEKPEAPKNILPLALLLEDPEDAALPAAGSDRPGSGRRKFDLVTSHLVLHHIPDLDSVLGTMHGCLATGGCVMLTDFEDFGADARRFHPASKMEGVARHGINAKAMHKLMETAGFVDVNVQPHWTMEKTVEKSEGEFERVHERGARAVLEAGEKMDFPFLVCFGRKA